MKYLDELNQQGFTFIRQAISPDQLKDLRQIFSKLEKKSGIRNLSQKFPDALNFIENKCIQEVIQNGKLVRSLLFDKHSQRNWQVDFHQDLTIAVKEKHELDDFGPWTVKEDVHSVQAPDSMLNQMISLRLHLDDCDEQNGALKVFPASHLQGKISQEKIVQLESETHSCNAQAGDLLLMRPLLVHGSSKTIEPTRRRVIHLEYSFCDLPQPLQWCSNA
jgi:ectoine hydroxylase-related dioxygenase (phytanoyl-CoA dioxygenase family)